MPTKKVKCPKCQGPSKWENNPYRPFCSERCRLLDLGHWLSGDYSIPDEELASDEEDEDSEGKSEKPPSIH